MRRMGWKKMGAAMLAAGFIFMGTGGAEAASRAEVAAIKVERPADFKYWTQDAAALRALTDYVTDVTDKKSANYIPEEERVAVFDLDGTLVGERAPGYFEWMMYLHRALHDPAYTASAEDRAVALESEAVMYGRQAAAEGLDLREFLSQESVFAGMTLPEYEDYVRAFMERPAEGLTNLKYGEAFFLPMAEVVSYLVENDFEVYIVSGSDRQLLRVLAGGVLAVDMDHFIGSDIELRASGQGEADNLDYKFVPGDTLVRGQGVVKNLKMNKVSAIMREIGRQPVLAFGNSSGDASMFNYTINGNKHKALAFSLCCDDLERDYGSLAAADKMYKACAANGWIPISMKHDFKTIFGENVKLAD